MQKLYVKLVEETEQASSRCAHKARSKTFEALRDSATGRFRKGDHVYYCLDCTAPQIVKVANDN